jgi:hypothetical protein
MPAMRSSKGKSPDDNDDEKNDDKKNDKGKGKAAADPYTRPKRTRVGFVIDLSPCVFAY